MIVIRKVLQEIEIVFFVELDCSLVVADDME